MHKDWLDQLLRTGIYNSSALLKDPEAHRDNLRGGNTVMLHDGRYVCDSNANCPRLALLRKHGIEQTPTLESLLSWSYGRAAESFLRQLLANANDGGLIITEEEQCQVEWVDEDDNTIFSARPDNLIVLKDSGEKVVIEIKSCQSDNVAIQVFHRLQPKLGALMQLAVGMDYHDTKFGYTLYCMMHWSSAYDRLTKKPMKFQPRFMSHYCTLDDRGVLFVDNKPTIVTVEGIENGVNTLVAYDRERKIPGQRPVFCDIFGKRFTYNYCKMYCNVSDVCDEFEYKLAIPLDDFLEAVEMEVDIK